MSPNPNRFIMSTYEYLMPIKFTLNGRQHCLPSGLFYEFMDNETDYVVMSDNIDLYILKIFHGIQFDDITTINMSALNVLELMALLSFIQCMKPKMNDIKEYLSRVMNCIIELIHDELKLLLLSRYLLKCGPIGIPVIDHNKYRDCMRWLLTKLSLNDVYYVSENSSSIYALRVKSGIMQLYVTDPGTNGDDLTKPGVKVIEGTYKMLRYVAEVIKPFAFIPKKDELWAKSVLESICITDCSDLIL